LGEEKSTVCLGSVSEPTATKGNLCVYTGSEGGISTNEPANNAFVGWKWGLAVFAGIGGTVKPDTATPFGFGVDALKTEEGYLNPRGSWAVTAE
jgi:hypothetical protein